VSKEVVFEKLFVLLGSSYRDGETFDFDFKNGIWQTSNISTNSFLRLYPGPVGQLGNLFMTNITEDTHKITFRDMTNVRVHTLECNSFIVYPGEHILISFIKFDKTWDVTTTRFS